MYTVGITATLKFICNTELKWKKKMLRAAFCAFCPQVSLFCVPNCKIPNEGRK